MDSGWIPTCWYLPPDGVPVLIWDGRFHVAKIRRGISEETREAMKSGKIEDPEEAYWSASTGYVTHKRSEIYTSADVHGNNLVPYCWDEDSGPHSWHGQDVKHWMALPNKPEGQYGRD